MISAISLCSVSQSFLTLCNPMDRSPPGSSVHGILQARIPGLLRTSQLPAFSMLCLCWYPGDYQETNTPEGPLSTISQKFLTVHTLFSSLTLPHPPKKCFLGLLFSC